MANEMTQVSKIREMLIQNGIPRASIKTNHKMESGTNGMFVADLAIVGEDGKEKAVFEVKAGKLSEMVKARMLVVAKLFLSIRPDVLFYAVCDDRVAEITNKSGALKWKDLEEFISSFKKLSPSKRHKRVATISWYFKKLELAKSELNSQIGCNNNIPDEDKRTVKYFFRGQSNFDLPLVPSLFRKFMDFPLLKEDEQTYYKEESYLIQEAERIFPSAFSGCKTDIDRMTVAQHYEIPTRLLDVTGNALVALYFAALPGKNNTDGAVFVFRASTYDFRLASIGGKTSKIAISGFHEGTQTDLPDEPFLVLPSFRTQRQSAQDGAFYMFGNEVNPVRMHDFPGNKCFKVRIPKRNKQDLLAQLEDECNIHKGSLFPESLANCSDKLKMDAVKRINAETLVDWTSK